MSDLSQILSRKTSLRKACRELDLDELQKLYDNLSEILQERQEETAQLKAEEEEKQAKIDSIKKQLEESGIDVSELVANLETAPKAKSKTVVKAKYEIKDASGKVHRWTGRGRTPKVFQEQLDKGRSKDDFLIKE